MKALLLHHGGDSASEDFYLDQNIVLQKKLKPCNTVILIISWQEHEHTEISVILHINLEPYKSPNFASFCFCNLIYFIINYELLLNSPTPKGSNLSKCISAINNPLNPPSVSSVFYKVS